MSIDLSDKINPNILKGFHPEINRIIQESMNVFNFDSHTQAEIDDTYEKMRNLMYNTLFEIILKAEQYSIDNRTQNFAPFLDNMLEEFELYVRLSEFKVEIAKQRSKELGKEIYYSSIPDTDFTLEVKNDTQDSNETCRYKLIYSPSKADVVE